MSGVHFAASPSARRVGSTPEPSVATNAERRALPGRVRRRPPIDPLLSPSQSRMRLKRRVGLLALAALRALGGFEVARRLTARRLRILCYHGFSVADEHRFRPGMWIRGDTFERRIAFLKRGGYPVLPLDDALERMAAGTLPAAAVVVTIDDGFAGTLPVAVPVLQRLDAPATLYLTTYYTLHQDPVFDLAVAYLLYKADVEVLDARALGIPDLTA